MRFDRFIRAEIRNRRLARTLRRGAAAVEFAFVAPLLIILVLGCIEFSRVLMVKNMLGQAAIAGSRVAILDGSTFSDVSKRVLESLPTIDPKNVTITCTPNTPSNAARGEVVTVTVDVPVAKVCWVFPSWVKGSLSGTAAMIRETAQ